jgi:hypothetical protein
MLGVWCEDIPKVASRLLWQQIIRDIPVASGVTSLLATLRGSDEDANLSLSLLMTHLLLGREKHSCHSSDVLFVCLFLVLCMFICLFVCLFVCEYFSLFYMRSF